MTHKSRTTGGKVDLLTRPEVRKIAHFGPRMEILPGVYPSFADCSVCSRPDQRLLAFLSQRLGNSFGEVDASVLTAPTSGLFTLGLYGDPGNPRGAEPKTEGPPEKGLRDWFPDAGILVARPRPEASKALGVALKGGHNDEHHNHNDVGSYVVALAGGTPLLDPGDAITHRPTREKLDRNICRRAASSYVL